jgi:pSer/pThr/pTyr-binding forkhead associated (FHA) protein
MSFQAAKPQHEHILMILDDKGRREMVLSEPYYSLGRSKNCDIRVCSQFISRHHATLRRFSDNGSDYYQILDGDGQGKFSVNGLLINGQKVDCHNLCPGDEVILGPQVSVVYQYRQHDKFSTLPSNDPFDITLIDPNMIEEEEEPTFWPTLTANEKFQGIVTTEEKERGIF